jgi:hypothetical protein
MAEIAIIHAGPAAPELKRLLHTLDSVGAREFHFMGDLIATLQYADKFSEDLDELNTELVQTNGYFQYCISHGDPEVFRKYQSRFMDHVAMASNRVAQYLHSTLVNQGRYGTDGKFPYEFHSFDGRIISLRRL